MSLQIGQQVVCINEVFSPCPYWRARVRAFPRLNRIYTIRDMREVGDILGLCVEEILNLRADFAEGFVEAAFNSRNFRPVRPTSIAIFRRLLVPADPMEVA